MTGGSASAQETMDAAVERAARAVERASHPEWTDEEFEIWWTKDPWFCKQINGWSSFRGTHKAKRLHEARIALEAALGPDWQPEVATEVIFRPLEWDRHTDLEEWYSRDPGLHVISDYWVFPSKEVPGKWALWIRGCGLDDLFDTASDARGAAAEDHLARMSGFTSAGPDPNAGPAGVRRGVPADALAGAPEPGAAKDPVAMETLEASPEMEP